MGKLIQPGKEIYTDEQKALIKSASSSDLRELAVKWGCTRRSLETKRWKLLNPGKHRECTRRWKKKNPKKFSKHKGRYYERSLVKAVNSGQDWTLFQIDWIFARNLTDEQIAEKIGRSVRAIQDMRSRIKTGIQ
jgi:hypothetical protein